MIVNFSGQIGSLKLFKTHRKKWYTTTFEIEGFPFLMITILE